MKSRWLLTALAVLLLALVGVGCGDDDDDDGGGAAATTTATQPAQQAEEFFTSARSERAREFVDKIIHH